jgi:hypothetical protein
MEAALASRCLLASQLLLLLLLLEEESQCFDLYFHWLNSYRLLTGRLHFYQHLRTQE